MTDARAVWAGVAIGVAVLVGAILVAVAGHG
jgi:hypothetical protein